MFVWPPIPLQPLDDGIDRKFAHSDRFALAMMIAPAAFIRSTMNASDGVLAGQRPRAAGIRHAGRVHVVLDDHRDARAIGGGRRRVAPCPAARRVGAGRSG